MDPDLNVLVTLLQPQVGSWPPSLLRVAVHIRDDIVRAYEAEHRNVDDILHPEHLHKFLPFNVRNYQIVEVTEIFSVVVNATPKD